jgi:TPR repeat protein
MREAARWLRVVAEGGDQASRVDLANLVLQGGGAAEDPSLIAGWFEQAALLATSPPLSTSASAWSKAWALSAMRSRPQPGCVAPSKVCRTPSTCMGAC